MTSTILLTGGTGTLGSRVAPLLRAPGREVRVLSRTSRPAAEGLVPVVGDLLTGAGVAAAVEGVTTVVHCAGNATADEQMSRRLVAAASGAGVSHLVNISVVGADRVPVRSRLDRMMFAYFAAQRAAERVVEESGLPWTTLRATQFHDLVLTVVQALGRLPVVPAPTGVRFQPVEVSEVATRLAELALGRPAGLVAELAGPRAYGVAELVRGYLAAAGRRPRPMMPLWLPGGAARALRDGANLGAGPATGVRTWEEFLAQRVPGSHPGVTKPSAA